MESPLRAWRAIARRQNCSLTGSRDFPPRVLMGNSRKKDSASGKCYQAMQDVVRYALTEELLIRRERPGRPHGGDPLQLRGQLQAARGRPLRLSQGRAGTPA